MRQLGGAGTRLVLTADGGLVNLAHAVRVEAVRHHGAWCARAVLVDGSTLTLWEFEGEREAGEYLAGLADPAPLLTVDE